MEMQIRHCRGNMPGNRPRLSPCIMFGCFFKCFNLKPHECDFRSSCRMSGCLHGKDFHAMQIVFDFIINVKQLTIWSNIAFLPTFWCLQKPCMDSYLVGQQELHLLFLCFYGNKWTLFLYNLQGLFTLLQCSGGS